MLNPPSRLKEKKKGTNELKSPETKTDSVLVMKYGKNW